MKYSKLCYLSDILSPVFGVSEWERRLNPGVPVQLQSGLLSLFVLLHRYSQTAKDVLSLHRFAA